MKQNETVKDLLEKYHDKIPWTKLFDKAYINII